MRQSYQDLDSLPLQKRWTIVDPYVSVIMRQSYQDLDSLSLQKRWMEQLLLQIGYEICRLLVTEPNYSDKTCTKEYCLPAKSDSAVMFCLQSYQGFMIDRSLVY